jgi:hypothetical protein
VAELHYHNYGGSNAPSRTMIDCVCWDSTIAWINNWKIVFSSKRGGSSDSYRPSCEWDPQSREVHRKHPAEAAVRLDQAAAG